jgi:hypothetical protein
MRYEYNILCRLVVKADSREEADRATSMSWNSPYEIGRIVVENATWFEMPGDKVIEKLAPDIPKPELVEVRKRRYSSKKAAEDAVNRLQEYIDKNSPHIHAMAKRIGINSASIYGWLNHQWKPTPESIQKITRFLDKEEHGNTGRSS